MLNICRPYECHLKGQSHYQTRWLVSKQGPIVSSLAELGAFVFDQFFN
jgi:hypothetical protein